MVIFERVINLSDNHNYGLTPGYLMKKASIRCQLFIPVLTGMAWWGGGGGEWNRPIIMEIGFDLLV